MRSITPLSPTALRGVFVLGATGRLGQMLRWAWGAHPEVHWQARMARPGYVLCDPWGESLAGHLAQARTVIMLAGPAGQGGDVHRRLAQVTLAAAPPEARVLLASSAAVYGGRTGPLHEDLPPAPLTEYGRAKAEMEAAVVDDPRVTALRIGNVAGADAILGGWRPGFRLDRFAAGHTPRRSYIGPATLARVLGDLATYPEPLPQVLNLAAPGTVAMGDLLDVAARPWGPQPASEATLAEVALSTARLLRYTTFAPEDSTPTQMVAQWRAMTAERTK